MGLIFLLVIGAAAGFLATRIMNMDLPVPHTVALGVIGAFIGGWILRLAGSALGMFGGFLGAVVGAVLLLWAYKKFVDKR